MAAMTRQELLKTLILQAKKNGFEFRKWYLQHLESSWIDFEASVATLSRGKRYYAMLFSHAFARHFWNPGGQMTFMVPTSTYIRHNKDGKLTSVTRKAYTRRTLKPDAWRYHLREMAASEDALQYIRRFIVRQEDVDHQQTSPVQTPPALHPAAHPESDHPQALPHPPLDSSLDRQRA